MPITAALAGYMIKMRDPAAGRLTRSGPYHASYPELANITLLFCKT
jgi:hypothetical protein